MAETRFDFDRVKGWCHAWPVAELLDTPLTNNLLERIRQILVAMRDERRSYPVDLIPLIRQALLLNGDGVRDPDLYVPLVATWPDANAWADAGFATRTTRELLHITARLPRLAWLGAGSDLFDDAFHEKASRRSDTVPMDPFAAKATRLDSFLSKGQREALRAMFHLPSGTTLIANLPTGSGKSLLGQAAALVDGGNGKITLVIVPTVALAIDQASRMTALFNQLDPGSEVGPLAYHGGISAEDKRKIRDALTNGSQRILFASPESVTGSLKRSVEAAARAGFIRYLVVDEAHLIVGWGDAFRPAFQLLPAVLKTLVNLNPGPPIRTVLASATMTSSTVQVLQRLFGPVTYMAAGLYLRAEPRYWFHDAVSEEIRTARILEAVANAPRPYILYVTKREDAVAWIRRLEQAGNRRVAVFHGGTQALERERILKAWSKNRLDGVVATSAFGLGVDKNDVRTVIHASLPESLDRYYQEVGRGGRDGNASVSLLVYRVDDIAVAASIATPTVISNEGGYDRWESMLQNAQVDPANALIYWVDLRGRPAHIKQSSDANKGWNLRTLTLMARAGLIRLHAIDGESNLIDAETPIAAEHATRAAIEILSTEHHARSSFDIALAQAREDTYRAAAEGMRAMIDVASNRFDLADVLTKTYTLTLPGANAMVQSACGGCPNDWAQRALGGQFHPPVVTRIPDMNVQVVSSGAVGVRQWKRQWPICADNTLLITFSDGHFTNEHLMKTMHILIEALPLHTMLLHKSMMKLLRVPLAKRLAKDWWRPIFLDIFTSDADETLYGASNEVRVVVLDENNRFPDNLWTSPSALQAILLPEDMMDAVHRTRRVIDTRPHIRHADFLARVAA